MNQYFAKVLHKEITTSFNGKKKKKTVRHKNYIIRKILLLKRC